ncbi:MAG: ATP-grasp family protein, partial [Myxococcales bacterium]|nr:ATP-grasp family protein [Myxococcales bacterium]
MQTNKAGEASGASPRIGVVGIPDGWSTRELLDAVERRTGFRHLIDMREVVVDFAAGRALSRGLDICELDAIIVKKIAKTYTPSAIDRLELLSYVESRGPRLFSKPERMIPLIDRVSGTVKLQRGRIPMPPTTVTEDREQALGALERYGAAVLKPLFSTKARGMRVLRRPSDPEERAALLETLTRFQAEEGPVLYLQKLLELPGRDLGVVFLGGEYLA